jgi:uncharacterized protein YecA (UPF0149 family)
MLIFLGKWRRIDFSPSYVKVVEDQHPGETMSKRRKGYPSESKVKRGVRIVHGNKELAEKLGRNDLCLCGYGKRFKKCCLKWGRL